jgi:hypothetical protein
VASETHTDPAPLTFKAAFCECFGCPDEAFGPKLFWRCLDPGRRPLAWLVRRLASGFFRADLEYLERAGETTTWFGLWTLANDIRDDAQLNYGLLRKGLHLRISGIRLIKTYEKITAHRRRALA